MMILAVPTDALSVNNLFSDCKNHTDDAYYQTKHRYDKTSKLHSCLLMIL